MPDATSGTSDPHELRQLAEAWPEDIFPTPTEDHQTKDAVAAHVLRRLAVPHFLACAQRIEALEEAVAELVRGAYYVSHYRSGKVQVNLDEAGGRAFVRLQVYEALRDEDET